MRISDWSSDVCSSDLLSGDGFPSVRPIDTESGDVQKDLTLGRGRELHQGAMCPNSVPARTVHGFGHRAVTVHQCDGLLEVALVLIEIRDCPLPEAAFLGVAASERSEEHTSELQSLMRISYAVFSLKKKKKQP